MILFWIAGFLFTFAFLNKCANTKDCQFKEIAMPGLKLFFTWPFTLGKHLSGKCINCTCACCSPKETEITQTEEEKEEAHSDETQADVEPQPDKPQRNDVN